MNILIAGCGYIGCAAGRLLTAKGHRVWGLCRGESSLARVREAGLEPFKADLRDAASLRALPPVDAVIACQAPARGARPGLPAAQAEDHRSAYLEATDGLIRALKPATSVRFIFVSSTSVLGPRGGAWTDADTKVDPDRLDDDAKVLWETERLVLSAPVRGMVLRLSGIYGPGRNRLDAVRSGRFAPTASSAWTNRVHRDDAASALELLIDRGEPGQTYLATDDTPATQRDLYGWLMEKLGRPAPVEEEKSKADAAVFASKRCSNAKLKKLGWVPRYSGYREGYGELVKGSQGSIKKNEGTAA